MPTSDLISAKQDTSRRYEPLTNGIQPNEQLISISKLKLVHNYCNISKNKYCHIVCHAPNQLVESVTFCYGINQVDNESRSCM